MDEALQRAIVKAGGKVAIARALGITHQAVSRWRNRCPPRHVLALERLTGVPREELAPDLYPPEERRRRSR